MRVYAKYLCISIAFLHYQSFFSQQKETGPIIADYGKVWKIKDPDYVTEKKEDLKAVFDVMTSPDSHEMVNPAIETVARYLNMHAQSGISPAKIHAALVIHNKASKDVMTHEAYEVKYGYENPNFLLMNALMDAGVEIVFCGQSSRSRDIPESQIIEGIQISLSAMTALIQLQNKGYRLIKF